MSGSDMDILDTNPYLPDARTNTYGVQSNIRKYREMEDQRRQKQVIPIPRVEPDPEILLEDDPIYSNKIQGLSDPHYKGDAPNLSGRRVVRERVRLLSISSRHRTKWELEEIPCDPITGDYTRLVCDEYGNQLVTRYDAEILNAEYYWGLHDLHLEPASATRKPGYRHTVQLVEPFIEKEGRIYVRREKDVTPSDYTVTLNTPIYHVKAIRVVASEIPNPYRTIGPHNNRIIFHIKDAKTGRILPFRRDYRSIPFYLIEIPEGNYTLRSLIGTIEDRCNEALRKYSQASSTNPTQYVQFRIDADEITGIIKISLQEVSSPNSHRHSNGHSHLHSQLHSDWHSHWHFHWRFWSHWTIPEEQSLYRMLGFARPYLKNPDGTDHYGPVFDNVWRLGYSQRPTDPGAGLEELRAEKGRLRPRPQPRPFSKINLAPETYIYLIIEGLNLNNDNILDTNPEQNIDNIFAKVQICNNSSIATSSCASPCISSINAECQNDILYNTAISTNKVYLESPLRILQTMRIRWVDAFGEPVDFGDREHSLTFEIVQFVDYLTETNFDSTRGVHPI